jgi:hypothetical protein
MDTKVTYIDRHDSLRPVGPQATQSLLDEKKIPTLQEHEYQQWAEFLFSAPLPLRLQVAETVLRHNSLHPHALGSFLTCATPSARYIAARLFHKISPPPPDLTEELLYHGAVNAVLSFFRTHHGLDHTAFKPLLFRVLKCGACNAALRRLKYTHDRSFPLRDLYGRSPRLDDQLFAKQMLEKIANLEPSPYPHFNPIQKFLRCLILQIGPDNALNPCTDSRNNPRSLRIDLTLLANELGISRNTAQGYLLMARPLLKQLFNQDGTLFTRAAPR